MFRSAVWVLRQPRYQALAAAAAVLALLCSIAGTWQIYRFDDSVHDNAALRQNAHAAAVALSTGLVPLVGDGRAPDRDAIRFRTVTVTGSYLPGSQQYLRDQDVDGAGGFYVITPLRTADAVLLVARGFVPAHGRPTPPADVPAPPVGPVHLTGRLQSAGTGDDGAAQLGHALIDTVNPVQQARRLDVPVYNAYLTLKPHQPGTSGLTALPPPDLTNPAGGAYEWQHFAYILQWYVFALLALALPFAFARHEVREARKRYLGIDPGAEQFDAEPPPESPRPELPAAPGPAGELAVPASDRTPARRDAVTAEQWRRAARLADRYGRSLGPDGPDAGARSAPRPPRRRRRGLAEADEPVAAPVGSTQAPYRSEGDRFHGAYNDYLWELALADGDMPDVLLPPGGPVDPRTTAAQPDFPIPEPRPATDDRPDRPEAKGP